MGIIELVDGLVVAIGKDGRLILVRIVIQPLFNMFLWLNELGDVLGDRIQVLFLQ